MAKLTYMDKKEIIRLYDEECVEREHLESLLK